MDDLAWRRLGARFRSVPANFRIERVQQRAEPGRPPELAPVLRDLAVRPGGRAQPARAQGSADRPVPEHLYQPRGGFRQGITCGVSSQSSGELLSLPPRRTEIEHSGALLDEFRQGGHLHRTADSVPEVLKEVHSQLPGGAQQGFHGVPALGPPGRARAVADHPFPDSEPRVQLHRIIVQGNLGMMQHHQKGTSYGPWFGRYVGPGHRNL